MKLPTLLITGCSGVIGRHLTESILDRYKVVALGKDYSRISEKIRHHKHFKFYERDLGAIRSPEELKVTENIDLVLHLAGVVSGSRLSEADYFAVNAESTKLLSEWASTKHCKGFLLASSVSVYGYQIQPLTEESPRLGQTVYARSKIKAEEYLETAEVPHSVFRIASVYGGGSKSFISKLFSLYKKGFYPLPTGERKKSILHLEDLVSALEAWISKVLEMKKILPVYVLSHPNSVTVPEVIREFKHVQPKAWGAVALPLFPFLAVIFEWFYKTLRRLKKLPYHDSPLAPLRHSIEIYSAESWADLGVKPVRDLRKGLSGDQ
ncbi:NAD-dependent epimerase/dehydratase family protein [Leptospira idonii]|uniref:NAD-dependent epimerase/dehydratase family protein n=1 Tax=Leptospira idonii TaxID=1193500 RepID=A0A4R9M259_9LEPT|nr:NAD-dependent epimerase/dehydratase family protein [Leptospira idonii]TGN19379.1 NAD-dependent epimerase/dehydratase family protein [Leptospira idonii]